MRPQVPSQMHLPVGENATKLSNMPNGHKLGTGATQGRLAINASGTGSYRCAAIDASVLQLMPPAQEEVILPPFAS